MHYIMLAMRRREHYKRLQFLEESLLLGYNSPFTEDELERKIIATKRNIDKITEEIKNEVRTEHGIR